MHLRWRLAVVTGAGSGLGREIALRLGRVGAGVLVADRDGGAAEQTAALVRERRVEAWPMAVDVCEDADLRLLAGRAHDLGGADLLVNNAGGWTEGGAQYPDADPAAWSRTVDLNLRAPMLLIQLFLDGLDRRRGRRDERGAVVNVASSAGVETGGYGSPEYAATKAALVRFTTAMANPAVAARARVTCVVPGWVGLPRAQEQWARLSPAEQERVGPLVPPGEVAGAVLDLLERGEPGAVVELLRGPDRPEGPGPP